MTGKIVHALYTWTIFQVIYLKMGAKTKYLLRFRSSQGHKSKALGNNADNFWNFQSILRPGKQDVKLTFQPNYTNIEE